MKIRIQLHQQKLKMEINTSKKIFFLILLGVLSSCVTHVYKYNSDFSGSKGDFFVLSNRSKSKFHCYSKNGINIGYRQMILQGFSEAEISQEGVTKDDFGYNFFFQIERSDSFLIYTTDNRIEERCDTLKLLTNDIQPNGTFIFEKLLTLGYSNGQKYPWNTLSYRFVKDSVHFYNSKTPVKTSIVEFIPSSNSCSECFDDHPIRVHIEKESGLPLTIEFTEVLLNELFQDVRLNCTDYESVRISRKSLRKILIR